MLKLEPDNANVRAKQALLLSAVNYRGERVAVVPAPQVSAPAAVNQEAEVVAAIQEWANAWSARDVAAYLDFYSPDFRTPHNMSRSAWEAERRRRLTGKSFIQVAVRTPQVTIDGTKATAKFDQSYRSGHYSSNDHKTLVWEKQDGKWKIVREDSRK